MYPDKHLKDLESSERREKLLENLVISGAFFTCFLIIGPLIHELGHISVLEYTGCNYGFSLGFSFLSGLHGTVSPYCGLGNTELLAFYLSGYAATITAGALTLLAGLRAGDFREKLAGMVSAGMFLSVTLGLGKGDLAAVSEIIEAGVSSMTASVLLIVAVGVILSLEMVIENQNGNISEGSTP